jgi:hypothetical protein
MALFAPVSLLLIPVVWVILISLGYACIYWALGVRPFGAALTMSGSSLLTLGTVPFVSLPITLVEFTEATIGLGLVALLLAYLPTMYSSFAKREAMVAMLEVRAGSPPTAWAMITRMHNIHGLDAQYLDNNWVQWEVWFTELEESHTSLAPVIFFRSQKPHRSWVTAAGAVLDCAALVTSTLDMPRDPQAQLTLRAGYIALRSIADFFQIEYDPNPAPDDPISITREEFDEVCDLLAETGVPLRQDRDQAWRDYVGWRVNYDAVLLRLAALTMAPYAPWSSDRSQPEWVQRRLREKQAASETV